MRSQYFAIALIVSSLGCSNDQSGSSTLPVGDLAAVSLKDAQSVHYSKYAGEAPPDMYPMMHDMLIDFSNPDQVVVTARTVSQSCTKEGVLNKDTINLISRLVAGLQLFYFKENGPEVADGLSELVEITLKDGTVVTYDMDNVHNDPTRIYASNGRDLIERLQLIEASLSTFCTPTQ